MTLVNKLVLVGKTQIGKRTIGMSDSNGVVTKANMGVEDSWYGGMVKEFRKVKNSGIMMCLDKKDNIINLAYVESDLTHKDRELLGLVPIENEDSLIDEDSRLSGVNGAIVEEVIENANKKKK